MTKLITKNVKSLKSAFTLVEIAIVLVIIGLLAGGVLVGKDLIKAAEVRSVIRDIDTYKTAVYTLKNKYNCLPGDCPNATAYFGAENATPATCQTTASYGSLTCDGSGNGQIGDGTYEMFRFWQHLAIAGLIKGQYTGVQGPNGGLHHVAGTNAPTTAIANASFGFSYLNFPSGDISTYGMNYGNMFWLGKISGGNSRPQNNLFTPADAFAIDQKIDDGFPARGTVIARMEGTSGNWNNNSSSCTTSTSATDYTGVYSTANTLVACAFMIKSGL